MNQRRRCGATACRIGDILRDADRLAEGFGVAAELGPKITVWLVR